MSVRIGNLCLSWFVSRTLVSGVFFVIVLTAGCGTRAALAPVVDSPSIEVPREHIVRSGETLYSIAWRYGLDFQDLAGWNRKAEPYTIYPKERLSLRGTGRAVPAKKPVRVVNPEKSKKRTTTTRKPVAKKPVKVSVSETRGPLRWRWPTEGRLVTKFKRGKSKGIDIAGKQGQPVLAAADGHVVYQGSGLKWYGKLIIVKHNNSYLSAYAHNDQTLVKEGDKVKSGEQIATMGDTGTKGYKVHFEIRRNGKPVDPLRYLPKS